VRQDRWWIARGPVLVTAVALLAALLTLLLPRVLPTSAAAQARAVAAPAPLPTGEPVAPGVVRQTHAFGPLGLEHRLDVYLPAGAPVRPRPTVLFLHGGSWEIGDKVEWVREATEVAQRGWTAVSVNYRRTPTAPWPAPLQDVRAALRWLQVHAGELGIDVERTGALGDSVGAQLAGLLGRPAPGLRPVRAVVSWSGISDLTGLLQQPSSGGCAVEPCLPTGLARKATRQLMRCVPVQCPQAYRDASPAADVTTGPATYAAVSERELIDPRQAWVLDAALARAKVASRVVVLPGTVHGRGYQSQVWDQSLRFLAAALTPETAPAFPRLPATVSLKPVRSRSLGQTVRLRGAVGPGQAGSSVTLQVRRPDGSWRTAGLAPVRGTVPGLTYELAWRPVQRGVTTWRALWQGSGGLATSPAVTVRVR
jgi:acetyl esterase/lipase